MTRATRRKKTELFLIHGRLKQVGCRIGRRKARLHEQWPWAKTNRLCESGVHFARAQTYQPSCTRAKSEPNHFTFR